jgi:hypothetical protein
MDIDVRGRGGGLRRAGRVAMAGGALALLAAGGAVAGEGGEAAAKDVRDPRAEAKGVMLEEMPDPRAAAATSEPDDETDAAVKGVVEDPSDEAGGIVLEEMPDPRGRTPGVGPDEKAPSGAEKLRIRGEGAAGASVPVGKEGARTPPER